MKLVVEGSFRMRSGVCVGVALLSGGTLVATACGSRTPLGEIEVADDIDSSSVGGAAAAGGGAGFPGAGGTANTGGFSPDGGTFVPVGPSCAGGLVCNGESCCTSINVPGGTFPQGRGTENCGTVGCPGKDGCPKGLTCSPVDQPEHLSTVSSFALDKYEVTVGRFRRFLAAYVSNTKSAPIDGAGANPAIPGTGWQSAWNGNLPASPAIFGDTSHLNCVPDFPKHTWTDAPGTSAQESRAINCVSWYEAFAFCIWDGGRLPTESEWEYAAAGGSDNRLYPWGSAAPDCTYANFYDGVAPCAGADGAVVSVGTTPKGNGRWGHVDMAGNVYERVFDWWAGYSTAASRDYATTTRDPDSGMIERVLRGGGFSNDTRLLLAAARVAFLADTHQVGVGVRCARAAQ